jgi:hypothetical protein
MKNLMTMEQIRTVGLEALARRLGPAGMVRFLQQFETGQGDYTTLRRTLFRHETVRSIAARIQKRRRRAG